MSQTVKIISLEKATHDVIKIQFEKPAGYEYKVGQAADISINKADWQDKLSCFTFTSLPEDDYLEFFIKVYPERARVTNELQKAKVGDELLLHDSFGDITNQGAGIFIAGGAGITPFIGIIKELVRDNKLGDSKLIFANKTQQDIIDKEYFEKTLGSNFINVLSDEQVANYEQGFVTAEIIKKYANASQDKFYLCGPPPMMKAVEGIFTTLGIQEENIIKEGF